ncbi:hypothetical protein CGRA01v4_11627 [Colletotrichum graminicola]|nr:hypothetical protein CGRA01v4_11627 [Colletotrichum graminicola]
MAPCLASAVFVAGAYSCIICTSRGRKSSPLPSPPLTPIDCVCLPLQHSVNSLPVCAVTVSVVMVKNCIPHLSMRPAWPCGRVSFSPASTRASSERPSGDRGSITSSRLRGILSDPRRRR